MSGEMGEKLDVRQNTMSANLSILLHAGLIRNERQGRTVRYYANMEGIGNLLDFLLQKCCGGSADLCSPFVKSICGNETVPRGHILKSSK